MYMARSIDNITDGGPLSTEDVYGMQKGYRRPKVNVRTDLFFLLSISFI